MIRKNCLDCNKQLSRAPQAVRCLSCAQKVKNQAYGFKKGHYPVNAFKKGETSGEKNVKWVGDNFKYETIHHWVSYHLGKAKLCMWCMSEENIQWANISHEYRREFNDWMQLCVKCHKRYDKGRSDIKRIFGEEVYVNEK